MMPCDTPPPPSPPIEDIINDGNDEDPDDSMYDFIEIDELDEHEEEMPEDDSIATFEGHKNSVFCCRFDGNNKYAVSGGQDDTAFVWNISDGSVKIECKGHLDSVIAASFSSDSQYVATSDMNGLIQVWDDIETGRTCFDFDAYEFTWTEWLKGTNILLAGSIDGSCWKFSIPDGATSVFENTGKACSTGSVSQNDEMLVTGYSDGTLKFWNLSNNALMSTLTGPASHSASVTTIKYNSDNSLILSGAEDGTAKLIRTSDFKVLWSITCCDNTQHDHEVVSVEDVGFCHNQPCIATGNNCGTLCIWDTNTKTRRAHTVLNNSVIKFICDENAPLLYVAVGDGKLLAIDTRNAQTVKYWLGHKASILDFTISSDRKLFLTASDDHTCKVFEKGDITL